MLTTPEMSTDYLQVPTNRRSNQSTPRRTASFTEKLNEHDERFTSNLSLRSTTHSILKKSNSPCNSTSSRLNVHYTPIVTANEDELELIPTTELPPLIENSHMDNHHHSKTSNQYRHITLLQRSTWPNLFSHGRSNDENADAYKIFSILYGLVIFIGGVAVSISHAIIPTEDAQNIKRLAEIYFTYLYWVSIIWIIFCIIDIVRHRKRINMTSTKIHQRDSNHIPLSNINVRLSGQKHSSPMSNEQISKAPTAPHFNLQLFDDSDEFQSEDNLNEKINERRDRSSTKQSEDDIDDSESLRHARHKSQSLDNLSMESVPVRRPRADTTRDVGTRRRALDPGAVHNLRSYVRNRKDSIVQRVIGYNYDDHSAAGGLYIRVGIGIFCLGTVIHSGLSILSNLENFPCARWTAVMDDFSRLLFSFIQFFFIFKHSNLIIRAHESLARLAVMHIVVTNLCVWFRMVVIETKSQIDEMAAHEMAMSHLAGGSSPINGSQNPFNPLQRQPLNPANCLAAEDAQQMNAFINDGYMRLKPLLYPCTIEFSLMCLTLFYLIWENIGKTFAHKMSDKASTKNVFMVNCHASIKGLFAGMIVFSCTVISIILYAVFRNKMADDYHGALFAGHHDNSYQRLHARAVMMTSTPMNRHHYAMMTRSPHLPARLSTSLPSSILTSAAGPFVSIPKTPKKILYSIAIVEIVNLCLLIISLSATTWALIKIRKFQYKRTTTRFDDVLILVSLTGTYLYTSFSAFALLSNKNHATWIAYLKTIIVLLEFIEATVHAFFILVALRKRLNRTNRNKYPAREIITLLIMIDLSLWFEETTTTTKHEANPFQLEFYHVIPWSIIAAIATPLQIFFRFHASVCLSHVWEHMYVLPAYALVAPHSL